MPSEARFSKKTIDFLKTAAEQKSPLWLDKHSEEHEEVLVAPLRALAQHLSGGLKNAPEVRGYKFPQRGFGRLRRPSHKIQPGQVAYRSWVHLQSSRPSKSRFDDNPGLYFYLSAESVFAGGGLYDASSRQIKQLRAWLSDDPEELGQLFKSKLFKSQFPRAFETDKVLKTFPRSYPQDHPRIDWLRLQAFYVKRDYSKRELYSREFPDLVLETWRQTLRFNELLYGALAADLWKFTPPAPESEFDEALDESPSRAELWDDRL